MTLAIYPKFHVIRIPDENTKLINTNNQTDNKPIIIYISLSIAFTFLIYVMFQYYYIE